MEKKRKTNKVKLDEALEKDLLIITCLMLFILVFLISGFMLLQIFELSLLEKKSEIRIVPYIEAKVSENEDEISSLDEEEKTERVRDYFTKRGSVLADYSEKFVEVAEKNGIDYRLLPAIATIESGAGKSNFRKYNPFGWGNIDFNSYDEAIEVVGNGMKNYYRLGLDTVEEIAPVYCPPNSKNWRDSVNYLMDLI